MLWKKLVHFGKFFRKKEITHGRGGQLSREAGAVAKQIAKEGKLATLRLPSGRSGCPGEEDQVGPCE
jgi:large subunit ribosomal protein L2